MNKALNSKLKAAIGGTASCPKCGNEMDRIIRNRIDRFISFISLRIFYVKRYLCYGCLWECRKLSVK